VTNSMTAAETLVSETGVLMGLVLAR